MERWSCDECGNFFRVWILSSPSAFLRCVLRAAGRATPHSVISSHSRTAFIQQVVFVGGRAILWGWLKPENWTWSTDPAARISWISSFFPEDSLSLFSLLHNYYDRVHLQLLLLLLISWMKGFHQKEKVSLSSRYLQYQHLPPGSLVWPIGRFRSATIRINNELFWVSDNHPPVLCFCS